MWGISSLRLKSRHCAEEDSHGRVVRMSVSPVQMYCNSWIFRILPRVDDMGMMLKIRSRLRLTINNPLIRTRAPARDSCSAFKLHSSGKVDSCAPLDCVCISPVNACSAAVFWPGWPEHPYLFVGGVPPDLARRGPSPCHDRHRGQAVEVCMLHPTHFYTLPADWCLWTIECLASLQALD